MSDKREWWLLKDAQHDYLTWEPNRHTIEDFIHVVEYSAYNELKEEIKKRNKDLMTVFAYCNLHIEKMWASEIVGILADCDFRDAKNKLKEIESKGGLK